MDQNKEMKLQCAGVRAIRNQQQVQPTDKWHLGSNTKAITATLIACILERKEDVNWTSTLGDILAQDGEQWSLHEDLRNVELQDLLRHRAGIRPNISLWWKLRLLKTKSAQEDRRRLMRSVLAEPPASPRGEFLYSNVGYIVLGLIAEVLCEGTAFENLVETHLYEKLGIHNAVWGPPGTSGSSPPDEPRGHAWSGSCFRKNWSSFEPDDLGSDNPVVYNSAGRAAMPLKEYMLFLQAHALQDETLLPRESWQKLHEPVGNYAMGWIVQETPQDGALLVHSGSNTRWYVTAGVIPRRKEAAVVATNCFGPKVADAVAQALKELFVRQADR